MANQLKSKAAGIDGLGFQMHISLEHPALESIAGALQKAVDTGLKVKITELDVRLNSAGNLTALTQELAEQQKQRYKSVVNAYLDIVPSSQRGGISFWGVSDADSWIVGLYGNPDWPLLFDNNLVGKPALEGVSEAFIAENTGATPIFRDTFDSQVTWYEDGSTNVTGLMSHDNQAKTMDIDISWAAGTDVYSIATTFDSGGTINFEENKTISFDVYVPTDYGNQMAIQAFIMDGNYTPAYIGYQFNYTPGEWSTITIPQVSNNYSFGYNGNPDFSSIDRIGLQFVANNSVLPSSKIIKVDNIKISE